MSATFIKDILSGSIVHQGYLTAAWIFLLLSVVSGVLVLGALASSLNKGVPAQLDVYDPAIVATAVLHVAVFLLGMAFFIYFVASNLSVAHPPPSAPKASQTFEGRLSNLQEAYFDVDGTEIHETARIALSIDSDLLQAAFREFPNGEVVVGGHCDERGSSDYNLRLARRRASSVEAFLIKSGIPAERLRIASYGKDSPQCQEPNERCWQRNRRVHLAPAK